MIHVWFIQNKDSFVYEGIHYPVSGLEGKPPELFCQGWILELGYFSALTSITIPLPLENNSVSLLLRQAQKFESPSGGAHSGQEIIDHGSELVSFAFRDA